MCRALSRACDRETQTRGTRLWGGSAGWAPGPRCASVDRAPIAKPWPTCWLLRKQGPTGCVKKNEPSQGVTTAGKSSHRDSCEDHACELAPRASHSNMVRPTFLPPPTRRTLPPSPPAPHYTRLHQRLLHQAPTPRHLPRLRCPLPHTPRCKTAGRRRRRRRRRINLEPRAYSISLKHTHTQTPPAHTRQPCPPKRRGGREGVPLSLSPLSLSLLLLSFFLGGFLSFFLSSPFFLLLLLLRGNTHAQRLAST